MFVIETKQLIMYGEIVFIVGVVTGALTHTAGKMQIFVVIPGHLLVK
jgi:hypothetical protein